MHVDVKGLLPCVSTVTVKEDTVILAESEFVVDGTTDLEGFQTNVGIVASPRDKKGDSFLVANTLVSVDQNNAKLPSRAMNPTSENMTLRKGVTYISGRSEFCA